MWSPGGYLVARSLAGIDTASLESLHRGFWWFHGVTAFVFIGYFVFGKFSHVLYGALNIFLRSFEPMGKLSHPDIDELLEEDEEALDRLDKFLDDAFLTGVPTVRIVHGHGMGILRRAIAEFLESHANVSRFEPAPRNQGGTGATIAYLED